MGNKRIDSFGAWCPSTFPNFNNDVLIFLSQDLPLPERPLDQVRYIICTKLGDGPQRLADDDASASLIGPSGLQLRIRGELTDEGRAREEQQNKKLRRDVDEGETAGESSAASAVAAALAENH